MRPETQREKLEVISSVGRAIGTWKQRKTQPLSEALYLDPELVESLSLASPEKGGV